MDEQQIVYLKEVIDNLVTYSATHVYQFDTDTPEPTRIPVHVGITMLNGRQTVYATMDNKIVWSKEIADAGSIPEILHKLAHQEIPFSTH